MNVSIFIDVADSTGAKFRIEKIFSASHHQVERLENNILLWVMKFRVACHRRCHTLRNRPQWFEILNFKCFSFEIIISKMRLSEPEILQRVRRSTPGWLWQPLSWLNYYDGIASRKEFRCQPSDAFRSSSARFEISFRSSESTPRLPCGTK